MKRALRLAGCCALIGAGLSVARSDDQPPKSKTPPATAPSRSAIIAGSSEAIATLPDVTSHATPPVTAADEIPTDPGSTDYSTTDPEEIANQTLRFRQEKREDPEMDVEEWKQRQEAAASEHDWMLREYQKQLRINGLDKTPEPTPDPYASAATDQDQDPLLPTSPPVRKNKLPQNNPDETENNQSPSSSLSAFSVKPLLPPLTSLSNLDSAHAESFTGDLHTDSNSPSSALGPAIPPQPGDTSTLDIPGMTAAQEGMPPNDLNLEDRLPDEPATTVKVHDDPNNFLPPTAPLNDTDAFYKKQAASLQPPNAPTFRALVSTPPVTPSYKEPQPSAKPVINGLRTHIADPFDFLNRPHDTGD